MAAPSASDEFVDAGAIARRLASCKPSLRYRAVRHLLSSFLPSASSIAESDLLKIWKGLFFCFWHCDKPLNQASLASRLAEGVSDLDLSVAVPYLNAYYTTLHREWSGIDYLRLDKFYLLNRRFLRHTFLLLRKSRWKPQLVANIVRIISEKSMLAGSNTESSARGLAYHVADSFLDEIEEFLPVGNDTLKLFLVPFYAALEKSDDKVLTGKVKGVFKRFLDCGVKFLDCLKEGIDVEPSVEKIGRVGLTMGFSEKFLELASIEDTLQANRKVLHWLHEKFFKLEKDLEKAGLEVAAPQFVEGMELADVASLAVTENGSEPNEEPPMKKRKKEKKIKNSDGEKRKRQKEENKKSVASIELASDDTEMACGVEIRTPGDTNSTGEVSLDCPEAIPLDETLLSNLQKQFEKVAEEAGMETLLVNGKVGKKRKRGKSVGQKTPCNADGAEEGSSSAIDSSTSEKRVRFSMKSNLVWKPHSPLPPQSLRVPPSATPRGSALKKGVPPGPVKEVLPIVKKAKNKAAKVKSVKKTLKSKKVPLTVKRIRKLQSSSA